MRNLYRFYGYAGLVAIFGSLLYGFRYDPAAPRTNVLLCVGLYAAWISLHLVMTTSWFKRSAWGLSGGSPAERRVFVLVGITSWLLMYAVHPPMPGPAIAVPSWVGFVGVLGVLLGMRAFFDGTSTATLDGFLAIPGADMTFSHGAETRLMTDGPYAQVRHPMYRAATFAGLASLLIHPNIAQLIWGLMMAVTFIAFIPVEERQLIAARGEEYLAYRRRTPYRILQRVW